MIRVDGTSARQMDLIDDRGTPLIPRRPGEKAMRRLRLVPKDVYAELERRRRRAQIAARKMIERDE